jgi:nitric oxide reductase NorD protein
MASLLSLLEPEEFVGRLWHRGATLKARPRFPGAASRLEEARGSLGVLFRGLGGEPSLAIVGRNRQAPGRPAARWRARLSGAPTEIASRRDSQSLLLPVVVDLWPDPADNRALHLWLAAFYAHLAFSAPAAPGVERDIAFLRDAEGATARALAAAPGLRTVHARLCERILSARPTHRAPPAEAAVERAVVALLGRDERAFAQSSEAALAEPRPRTYRPFTPVALWGEAIETADGPPPADAAPEPPRSSAQLDGVVRKSRRDPQDETQRRDYLALNRFEKLLTLAQSMNLARPVEDDDDEGARHAAENSAEIVLSPHRKSPTSRLKLELELSPAAATDVAASEGLRYPEWDWRRRAYRKDACRVRVTSLLASESDWRPSQEALRRIHRVRRQFESLRPQREIARAQVDGDDLDLDAVVRARADFMAGGDASDRLYCSAREQRRDFAIALLVDASLSTDAFVGARRVIDIARETALMFCHALDAAGDPHAVYGFTSKGRDDVRIEIVKDFEEPMSPAIAQRLGALKPGWYTRIGAAVRHATAELEKAAARDRLLLVLTDGKPNDVDHYEGRFGVEDTRRAIQEARRRGLRPFGVAIDARAEARFPLLFGRGGFAVVRDPAHLPAAMPALLRRLACR